MLLTLIANDQRRGSREKKVNKLSLPQFELCITLSYTEMEGALGWGQLGLCGGGVGGSTAPVMEGGGGAQGVEVNETAFYQRAVVRPPGRCNALTACRLIA